MCDTNDSPTVTQTHTHKRTGQERVKRKQLKSRDASRHPQFHVHTSTAATASEAQHLLKLRRGRLQPETQPEEHLCVNCGAKWSVPLTRSVPRDWGLTGLRENNNDLIKM